MAHVVFMATLAANIVFAALVFGSCIVATFAPNHVPGMRPFGLDVVPRLIAVALACVILFALARSFKDIAEGGSPFTLAQSKRLFVIGCLLLAGVAAEALAFGSPAPAISVAEVRVGYDDLATPDTIYLNAAYLGGALISFCLSFVFKYGALLQQLSDDTV